MITNTRLTQLCNTAHHCQKQVDKMNATLLENDFTDLYNFVRDHMKSSKVEPGNGQTDSPYVALLFGK